MEVCARRRPQEPDFPLGSRVRTSLGDPEVQSLQSQSFLLLWRQVMSCGSALPEQLQEMAGAEGGSKVRICQ